jgi:putative hemolysin
MNDLMHSILIELAVIFILILANGLLAMAEMALVSAKRSQLEQEANRGRRSASLALGMALDPDRFLPSVQIGITLIGTVAAVFGGATLADALATWLKQFAPLESSAEPIALSLVALGITYVTLVIGELVPKRLALGHPERIALRVAAPLHLFNKLASPLVAILRGSTRFILWIFRFKPPVEAAVTQEEVRGMIKAGAEAGVFEDSEREILHRALRIGDRRASLLMTPRRQVVWIDLADPPEKIQQIFQSSPHSRFPVCDETLDNIVGIIQAKDLLLRGFQNKPFDIHGILRMPLFIYEGTSALRVLEIFRSSGGQFAVVLDEYGSVEGIITLTDLLEALVGELPEPNQFADPPALQREDGSWLFSGNLPLDEAAEHLQIPAFPEGDYQTIAGFLISGLGRIPKVGDTHLALGFRFEVVDMDGNRVDKILAARSIEPPAAESKKND